MWDPLPPVWDFFPILPFIVGGSPMLKTVKTWKWDSGRPPPPCFFKIPTFSRFFLGGASLSTGQIYSEVLLTRTIM